jgi:hypothetical protein
MMSTTTHPRSPSCCVLLLVLALAPACSDDFFGFTGSDELGDGDSTETGDDPPVSEGIRVYPRYQLVDVSAVVSVEDAVAGVPTSCPLDGQGSYFCDTIDLAASDVIVRVERDGFEPEVRGLARPYGYIDMLDVHLVPVGGPLGVWSACVVRDAYPDCDGVCGAETKTCLPTSCATEDPNAPVATELGYEGLECAGLPTRVEEQPCSSSHPAAFTDSVRCCCAA